MRKHYPIQFVLWPIVNLIAIFNHNKVKKNKHGFKGSGNRHEVKAHNLGNQLEVLQSQTPVLIVFVCYSSVFMRLLPACSLSCLVLFTLWKEQQNHYLLFLLQQRYQEPFASLSDCQGNPVWCEGIWLMTPATVSSRSEWLAGGTQGRSLQPGLEQAEDGEKELGIVFDSDFVDFILFYFFVKLETVLLVHSGVHMYLCSVCVYLCAHFVFLWERGVKKDPSLLRCPRMQQSAQGENMSACVCVCVCVRACVCV